MRRQTWWAWLAVAIVALLAGCSDDDAPINGGAGFTVSGTVVNVLEAAGEAGASVQLFLNGAPFGAAVQTNANGDYTIQGVPAGTYTLVVTRAGAAPLMRTVSGPLVVNQNLGGADVQTLTQAQFDQLTGIAPPPDPSTGKLVVAGLNEQGELVDVTVTIAGVAPVGPAAPAELSVAPGTYTVSVTGNGTTIVVPGVSLIGGEITVLSVELTGVAPADDFIVTGGAVDFFTGNPLAGISIALMQQNVPLGAPVLTMPDGTYLFADVPAGMNYRLRGEAVGYADSVVGPFAVNANRSGLLVPMASILDLQANEGINEPLDDTTATLAVYGRGLQGQFNPVVTLNGGPEIINATSPVVVEDLAPGAYDITVTNPVTDETVSLLGVTLTGGEITVLEARTGMNAAP
ncbi:MAG TPA: carboxypeptidase-like regulatory domain-containing protein [Armatimonadota bacterium]|nr:carboxypeptidase-like regulatory domain-containing protein [Armatimonadota bacterium]